MKAIFCLLTAWSLVASRAGGTNDHRLELRLTNGAVAISTFSATNNWVRLQASSNFTDWSGVANIDGEAIGYQIPVRRNLQYFRAVVTEPPSGPAIPYSNQLQKGRLGPVMSASSAEPSWVKFTIDLEEPDKVYFQNVAHNRFHYDFVKQYLPAFTNIGPQAFESLALRTNNQRLLLGTVFFQPKHTLGNEIAIQFVGADAYTPEFISGMFTNVARRIVRTNAPLLYFPDYAQMETALLHQETLRARGIEVASLERWVQGEATYSKGWAIGTLKFFAVNEVEAAYRNGALTQHDILLTDYIPADLPKVAGILSLFPSSPGSHVAILAQTAGIPFAYLNSPELRARAQSLAGREVLVDASNVARGDDVRLLEGGPRLDTVRAQMLALKQIPPLQFPPKARSRVFAKDTATLVASDMKFFGGKATHFRFLRKAVPTNSPNAIAISFNLWDDFMSNVVVNGRSLRDEIAARLAAVAPTGNRTQIAIELDRIRELIKDVDFPATLREPVIAALAPFDRHKNIRFRSSTNVEDGDEFTGAGLYDSFSGCLQDDLDADETGPCDCDPAEEKERGVFRAIKKVFASFYNENAWWARRDYSVNENDVGMAILAHHSFPDEIEFANGVGTTLATVPWPGTIWPEHTLITQNGATPVANPDGSARPEVATWRNEGLGYYASYSQRSSLLPVGATVLTLDEARSFLTMFDRIALAYHAEFTNKSRFGLDFEFKKTDTGLIIKQVRPLPLKSFQGGPKPPGFIIDEPSALSTELLMFGGVAPNHFAKSEIRLTARSSRLDEANLRTNIYANLDIAVFDDGQVRRFNGRFEDLPHFSYSAGTNQLTNEFRLSSQPGAPLYRLITRIPDLTDPIQTIQDWDVQLHAIYNRDFSIITWDYYRFGDKGRPIPTNEFRTQLKPTPTTNSNSIFVWRNGSATNGMTVRSEYYWAALAASEMAGDGYTSALIQWNQTTISGLTTEPITLRSPWAQSYKCARKNFQEEFYFEPEVEPTLPAETRAQLRAQNIRIIAYLAEEFFLIGFDGSIRRMPGTMRGEPHFGF